MIRTKICLFLPGEKYRHNYILKHSLEPWLIDMIIIFIQILNINVLHRYVNEIKGNLYKQYQRLIDSMKKYL